MSTRPLVVLGATGSIGTNALDVAARLDIPVAGLAARRPGSELAAVARSRPDAKVAVVGGDAGERRRFAGLIPNEVIFGADAVTDLAAMAGTVVVNGIVGVAGLPATMAAVTAGNRLALANKESVVAGGALVKAAAAAHGAEVIPVDSEHSALFQLLTHQPEVTGLVITASGGPFRGRAAIDLGGVTPEEALRHPTWSMGRRISIDSATLANKGLEVIEAHALFGIPFDDIEVVVHPQSLVHSLVTLADGSMMGHVGATDMRIAIQYALTHPARLDSGVPFRLAGRSLTFEEVDRRTFRALDLAYVAGRSGGTAPCVFNAADEVAVEAFLERRIPFLAIPDVIERTLEHVQPATARSVEEVLAADAEARAVATELVSAGRVGSN